MQRRREGNGVEGGSLFGFIYTCGGEKQVSSDPVYLIHIILCCYQNTCNYVCNE